MDKREVFVSLWEKAGGVNAEKGILKEISQKLKVPEGTIRRWKSEYVKKNKMNVQRTFGERSVKNERSQEEVKSTKLEIQKKIISGETKEEILAETGISERTFFRYKNELLEYMNKMSQEVLDEAVEKAYPDRKEIIKKLQSDIQNADNFIIRTSLIKTQHL